jgi:Cu/Ag efflux protein CusF
MSTKATAALAIALCMTGATALSAQVPISRSKTISGSATVQAIDTTSRTITLRDEKGLEDTYSVGPEVKRFNELKVGDTVKMTYYESLVMKMRKPGTDREPVATSGAVVKRTGGDLPGGTISVQEQATVTIKAIDPAIPSVTVTTADGREVTRKVEDKKNIEGLKVGDTIDLTYTRALLTSIDRAK